MDLNDIADVMTGSGVDLKAEEAALHFGAGPARSVYTGMGQPAYFDSQTRIMANNVPGSRDSFYGGGTLNQHATAFSPVSLQAESEARARVAKRAQAERKQHHLNEPFLLPGVMVRKINKAGDTTQVRPPMEGVFMPTPGNITRLLVQGPEGQEKLALLTHEPILALQSGMGDILTLLSFAARDRIRSVLEDSASIAYQRKMTGSGVVPPDFLDIVKGVGAAKETTALPAPLIGEQGPGAQSRKRKPYTLDTLMSHANSHKDPILKLMIYQHPYQKQISNWQCQLRRLHTRIYLPSLCKLKRTQRRNSRKHDWQSVLNEPLHRSSTHQILRLEVDQFLVHPLRVLLPWREWRQTRGSQRRKLNDATKQLRRPVKQMQRRTRSA